MKTIRILFLFILVSFFPLITFPQIFGVRSGANLSNMLVNVDDRTISADYKMNPGFHIGTTVEFSISEVFSIESAVLLTTIGCRESRTNTVTNFSYEYKNWKKLLYLDFPVTGIVTGDIGKVNVYGVIGSNLVLTKSEK